MNIRLTAAVLIFLVPFTVLQVTAMDGKSAFLQAAKSDNSAKLKELTQQGVDINSADDNGKTALYWSSSLGHLNAVKFLLDNGANANLRDRNKETPLIAAAREGRDQVVTMLLENRKIARLDYRSLADVLHAAKAAGKAHSGRSGIIDIDAVDRRGMTALMAAAALGRTKVMEALLRQGAGTRIHDKNGLGALDIAEQKKRNDAADLLRNWYKTGNTINKIYSAIDNSNAEDLKQIVKSPEISNLEDKDGALPIFYAAEKNLPDMIRLLNSLGAYVNAQNSKGLTPLHIAAKLGAREAVVTLLTLGADPDAKDATGTMALDSAPAEASEIREILRDHYQYGSKLIEAARSGNLDEIKRLLSLGAAVNAQDKNGITPLIAAAGGGHPESVEFLLTVGADPNLKNTDNETALMAAARICSPEIITTLLKNGADANQKDSLGYAVLKTAFEQKLDGDESCSKGFDALKAYLEEHSPSYRLGNASETGNLLLVRELVNTGADVNFEDEFELTPLMVAAKEGHAEVVSFLVSEGANTAGAMMLAAEAGKREVVETLLKLGGDSSGAIAAAVSAGNLDVTKLLLTQKSDVNEIHTDESGYSATLLILAAASGHIEIVKLLLDKGADPNLTDNEGKTARDNAEKAEHPEIGDVLKSYKPEKISGTNKPDKGKR